MKKKMYNRSLQFHLREIAPLPPPQPPAADLPHLCYDITQLCRRCCDCGKLNKFCLSSALKILQLGKFYF